MKKIYLTITLLLFVVATAQQNGVVEYEYSYNPNIGKSPVNQTEYDANNLANAAFEYAKQFKYILKFNPQESLYYVETGMSSEDVQYPMAFGLAKLVMGKGIYYQNAKQRYILNQKKSMHKDYLVKDTLKNDWTINYEKKYIGGYKCYKATKKCKCGKDIEAWFTPEIPLPFGPAGYGGTPGLILQVTFYKHTLTLKKIKLLSKPLNITPPNVGEPITQSKLEDLQWERRMELMQRRRH